MSNFLKEFKFDKSPLNITYLDKEPLKLNSEFIFFHNKNKFRKELNRLQYLIKSYTNIPLHAAGIRDSYLKEDLSENYLIILFTISDIVKKASEIIEANLSVEIKPGCFYLESNTDYILLISRDMEGLIFGIDTLESILEQVLEDYTIQKRFGDYIKVCTFKVSDCKNTLT
ncbi:MAG: hypothetical protein ACFFCV_11210 [Promethearchaeota archaeon]